MHRWLGSLCFVLASLNPLFFSIAHGHDGPLDIYGCHADKDQRYYHCHEGPYTRLSFDSKAQMVQRLKHQYIALGRAWPYGDTTSVPQEAQVSVSQAAVGQKPAAQGKSLRPIREAGMKAVAQRPAANQSSNTRVARTNRSESKNTTQARLPSAPRRLGEPELKVWITQFRADGRPIFESKEGERFFLDDLGNKITLRRRES